MVELFQKLAGVEGTESPSDLRRGRNTQDFRKSSSFWYFFSSLKEKKYDRTVCIQSKAVAFRKFFLRATAPFIHKLFRRIVPGLPDAGNALFKKDNHARNRTDNDENADHSHAHVLEVFRKAHGMEFKVSEEGREVYRQKYRKICHKIHCQYLLSHEEAQDQTTRDNGCDLSGNVDADGVHEKEVLGVFLEAHLVNDTAGHRERGNTCGTDHGVDLLLEEQIQELSEENAARANLPGRSSCFAAAFCPS